MHCDHVDLQGSVDKDTARAFATDATSACTVQADYSRATHLASMIAGRGVGVVGVAPRATIVPVAVVSPSSQTARVSDALRGMLYAAGQACDIILLPFDESCITIQPSSPATATGGSVWDAVARVVDEATRLGSLVVMQAGDDSSLIPMSSAITVGATAPRSFWCPLDVPAGACSTEPTATLDGRAMPIDYMEPAFYCTAGAQLDLFAPGGTDNRVAINCQSCPQSLTHFTRVVGAAAMMKGGASTYAFASGSGVAAAMTSGVAALAMHQNPQLRGMPALLKAQLLGASSRMPVASSGPVYGRGFLTCNAALELH